ncbi:MAG: hypothetical protein UW64_C0021G0014 [Microgenomates group bacterium GW2011_GWC1_44_37]|nr:MAG: hypothetical protein UW64_C0021G0014 [Microgenomates group bacterium GW2011_GWC1_44_37]
MKTKMKSQNKKTLVSALLLLVSLALIFGVALLIKTGNFNDQGRASSGTIIFAIRPAELKLVAIKPIVARSQTPDGQRISPSVRGLPRR